MLEFESRKDLVAIFGALVRIEHNGDAPGLRYVLENDQVLVTLFDGWVRRGGRQWWRARGCWRAGRAAGQRQRQRGQRQRRSVAPAAGAATTQRPVACPT